MFCRPTSDPSRSSARSAPCSTWAVECSSASPSIRGNVLPRWTGILLIAAALASLSAAILPHELARYAAVPMGVALVALGVALVAQQRKPAVVERGRLSRPSPSAIGVAGAGSGLPPRSPHGDEDMESQFEIRVQEHLDAEWADWFEGMPLSPEPDGITVLSGTIVDQAALQGCSAESPIWA